jgi:hypothetical protein
LVDEHVDLGGAPGAANAGDMAMTLIHSALASLVCGLGLGLCAHCFLVDAMDVGSYR